MQPHVLLARGQVLICQITTSNVLHGVIADWVRAGWPVIVYFQGQSSIADKLDNTFERVRDDGGRLPLCSCVGTPGAHDHAKPLLN